MVKDNICRIQARISEICRRVNRNPEEINLVAVTKYSAPEDILEAINAGIKHIGENKVKDAEMKFTGLGEAASKVQKHMIGHLQTNKVKKAIEIFDIIQSVDSEKLLSAIEKEAAKTGRVIDILIEVNTAQEEQKFGIGVSEVHSLVEKASQCPHIRLLGFMAMAPFTDDKERIRRAFRGLKDISVRISEEFASSPNIQMKHLSMGMTNDFEIAVEEGANVLRIGRAIFTE